MTDAEILLSELNGSHLVYDGDHNIVARQISSELFDDLWDYIARSGK